MPSLRLKSSPVSTTFLHFVNLRVSISRALSHLRWSERPKNTNWRLRVVELIQTFSTLQSTHLLSGNLKEVFEKSHDTSKV